MSTINANMTAAERINHDAHTLAHLRDLINVDAEDFTHWLQDNPHHSLALSACLCDYLDFCRDQPPR